MDACGLVASELTVVSVRYLQARSVYTLSRADFAAGLCHRLSMLPCGCEQALGSACLPVRTGVPC